MLGHRRLPRSGSHSLTHLSEPFPTCFAPFTSYAVWVVASVSQALSRNAQRTEDERVPESASRAVAEQFEEPTVAEGFVNVLNIRTE